MDVEDGQVGVREEKHTMFDYRNGWSVDQSLNVGPESPRLVVVGWGIGLIRLKTSSEIEEKWVFFIYPRCRVVGRLS